MSNHITTGLMSSLTDNWPTPAYVFDRLNEEFHFTLDVCADDLNHKCPNYFTKETDGLKQEWTGTCWMNPPYGRVIGDWIKKAYESSRGGGYCGLSYSSQDRYKVVEGIRYACI